MKIIKLHTRYGDDEIFVNADTINAFKGLHRNGSNGKDWQFSVVTTNFFQIEVKETAEEINNLINQ